MVLNLEKIKSLRIRYRYIFEFLASRKNSYPFYPLAYVEAGVKEQEAELKMFFKDLESFGYGKYLKSSRGGVARFVVPFEGPTMLHVANLALGKQVATDMDINPRGIDDYTEYKTFTTQKTAAPVIPKPMQKIHSHPEDVHNRATVTGVRREPLVIHTFPYNGVEVSVGLPKGFKLDDPKDFAEMLAMMLKHDSAT